MTCTFFFYNNLKQDYYLDLIEKNYKKMIAYTEVSYTSEDRSKLILGEGMRLDGILVFFNDIFFNVLKKINNLNDIKTYKKRYKIEEIDVYGDDKIYKAFIIF